MALNQFEKEIIQAVLIADTNVEYLKPFSKQNSTALLPLVNVPVLDYALETLNRSGIEEVFVYASVHLQALRDYIKQSSIKHVSWSMNMVVHVVGGEGCRCFGDAMRDLDAKALIRGNFILLGADTISNANLRQIYEQHKRTLKFDKGAAATIILKEATNHQRTGNELMIAFDTMNMRLHHHQRLRTNHKESHFEVPLEVFISNSHVSIQHNLIDPQIAIGSPSMLSLFSDNFDFQTRDDFVRGILINEELLGSRIYVAFLPREQYAQKVNNWLAYQIVSRDIINRWTYPLVPDMGVIQLAQVYVCQKNNIYKSPQANVTKVTLRENVVVQANCTLDIGTVVSNSVIGANCRIGQNCELKHAYLFANVQVGKDCRLQHCVIAENTVIGSNSTLQCSIVGQNCVLPKSTKLNKQLVNSTGMEDNENDMSDNTTVSTKLSEHAYIVDDQLTQENAYDSEDEDILQPESVSIPKLSVLPHTYAESDYSSISSDNDDDESRAVSPLPDDASLFFSEVMDSLERGYREKSNPDFLILEINSSRYAYNMSLREVNFYVAKAIFSMQHIQEPANDDVMTALGQILNQLGPVLLNYIKTEDAMLDCLKALEAIYVENIFVQRRFMQIVHLLYMGDFLTEDPILSWYKLVQLDAHNPLRVVRMTEFINWLKEASEEETDDDDDNDDNDDDEDNNQK